jgi:hypothetical protein
VDENAPELVGAEGLGQRPLAKVQRVEAHETVELLLRGGEESGLAQDSPEPPCALGPTREAAALGALLAPLLIEGGAPLVRLLLHAGGEDPDAQVHHPLVRIDPRRPDRVASDIQPQRDHGSLPCYPNPKNEITS